jgi:hypothetical protein
MNDPLSNKKGSAGKPVQKTGLYQLNTNDKVIPAGKKAAALGGKKSKKKKGSGKKPRRMIVEHMDDDSFGIEHQHDPDAATGVTPKPEKFTAPNPKALTRHVRNTYSDGDEEDMQ